MTGKWGDVVEPFYDATSNPAQPDFADISAVVSKFTAEPTAPIKASAQLAGNATHPNRPVDFKDIKVAVGAFMGTSFGDSFGVTGPCDCPSAVTCEATACTFDLHCTLGYCVDNFCTDACRRCN